MRKFLGFWIGAVLLAGAIGALVVEPGSGGQAELVLLHRAAAFAPEVPVRATWRMELSGDGVDDVAIDFGEMHSDPATGAFYGHFEVPDAGIQIEMVSYDPSELFVSTPATRRPDGAPGWAHVAVSGELAQQATAAVGFDPETILAPLREVTDVAVSGGESVDGVDTTHYEASISVEDFVALNPSAPGVEQLLSSGIEVEVTMLVDVGDDGLIRRFTVEVRAPEESFTFRTTLTVHTDGVSIPPNPTAADVTSERTASTQTELQALIQQLALPGG